MSDRALTSTGQTVLITGATSGIGRDAAKYLAARGYRVIGTGRDLAALESLATESDGAIVTHPLDINRQESIDALVSWFATTFGQGSPDVLVNNAGVAVPGCLYDVPMDRLRFQFETNVFGLMALTKAFMPDMMARGSGRIVNVSSVSGRTKVPLMGAYHASKHALEALSDALRIELAPFGIKVVIIEPGPIQSDIPNRAKSELLAFAGPDSPYANVYDAGMKRIDRFVKTAASAEHTSKAIFTAVSHPNPCARYVVPWYNVFQILIQAHIPTAIADWVIGFATGITRRNMKPVKRS